MDRVEWFGAEPVSVMALSYARDLGDHGGDLPIGWEGSFFLTKPSC